ncbi:major facilitator superfamily domain-containing protein [Ilyonectria sp. MPI-CAGE-AT-0026]|nr:major facilitator superfamily domain-containing protein [Ilyonectria sp. MPI-CAGE-AT-0026]
MEALVRRDPAIEISPDIEPASISSLEKATREKSTTQPLIISDWSHDAEVKLRRKVDFIILPILMLGLFTLQLDKGNVAYALTTSFTDDLGIDKNKVNYGNQLMLAAIVIFEIPFNLILSRVGPAKWLTIQIFAWGTIATAQTAIHNLSGFYATRFMLGMWEAGYLAASLTILASFYTRKEMAMRVTLVYIGNYFSAGMGGLIAGAIFHIPESTGLKSWQWLFLIDGLFTLVVGVFFIFFMPRSTKNTVPLCGLKQLDFFTEEERHILNNRVVLDDPRKVVGLSGIGFKRVFRILSTSPRIWGHFAINLITLTPKGGLGTYAPTIIKNMGFSSITASNLSSVNNFGVCILAILVAWISDKTSSRGPLCLLCGVYSLVFSGVQYAIVRSHDVWLKYAILTVFTSGTAVSQGINDAWFSVNTPDAQERCIGLALAVAGSNLGGLSGQNIFVKSDAPYYYDGFLKILCIYAGSIVLIALMILYYWNDNRVMEKSTQGDEVVASEGVEVVEANIGVSKVRNQL